MQTSAPLTSETAKVRTALAERLRGVPVIQGRPQERQLDERAAKQRERRFTATPLTGFGAL
jgi:hypothetical protein